jgi:hypothetical protein
MHPGESCSQTAKCSPASPSTLLLPSYIRQQGTQINIDDPFALPAPSISELSTQALNRSRQTVADIRAQAEVARAAIPPPPPH